MIMCRSPVLITTFLALVWSAPAVKAGPVQPVTGEQFHELVDAQQVELQRALERALPDTLGYFITGPLDPFVSAWASMSDRLYSSVRVMAPTIDLADSALKTLYYDTAFSIVENVFPTQRADGSDWAEILKAVWRGDTTYIRITDYQTLRADIWARSKVYAGFSPEIDDHAVGNYAVTVYGYMKYVAAGNNQAVEPDPTRYGLPAEMGLYAEPPPYVIQGYQNYKDSLTKYSLINLDFAHGKAGFIPSDSILNVIMRSAPEVAFPNKEEPMFQDECRKFFQRGGDMRSINTLTRKGFDTLSPGEYFFAVGMTGKVRFGKETPREEVTRIEKETGKKVPRANHAFLFPGEYILTAGAFFIENQGGSPRIARINAQSGHYFYSNVSPTIQEDLSVHSDEYFMSLGHFLRSLDSLGIPYAGVRLSKIE
jgi:hypothetical protein